MLLDPARESDPRRPPSRDPPSADGRHDIARIARRRCRNCARSRKTSPSRRQIEAVVASQSSTAEAISVSNTACRSNAERLMTFSTSAVAVCCCSASVRSRVRACTSSNRRTFSIAMTAWSAKVCTSSTWRCVNEPGCSRASDEDADRRHRRASAARQRRAKVGRRSKTRRYLRIVRIIEQVGDACATSPVMSTRPAAVPRPGRVGRPRSRRPKSSATIAAIASHLNDIAIAQTKIGPLPALAKFVRPTRPACRAPLADRTPSG